MIFSLATLCSLRRTHGPAMVFLRSLVCRKTAPCSSSLTVMGHRCSVMPVRRLDLLHCHMLLRVRTSAASGGSPLFRLFLPNAQARLFFTNTPAKKEQLKLDMELLEKYLQRKCSKKVLFTYGSRIESIFYNLCALSILCACSYGSYLIYMSEDYEVVNTPPPMGQFPVFYKRFDLNPYRNYIAAGVFVTGIVFMAGILRHTLRSVRSLVLLQDRETLAISTSTLFGSTRTRNVHHSHLRTFKLNYLLDDYDSCFLIRRGQLISYILEIRGVIHDPDALKKTFAHSNDDSEVPPTERMT